MSPPLFEVISALTLYDVDLTERKTKEPSYDVACDVRVRTGAGSVRMGALLSTVREQRAADSFAFSELCRLRCRFL